MAIVKSKKEMHDYYHERSIAFGRIFDEQSPFTHVVLEDLAKFCRANDTTFHPDPRVHALMEGRREVWLRIKDFITLNADKLLEKYSKEVTVSENNTKENKI